jgi:DNA-binding response OmpR family regulator
VLETAGFEVVGPLSSVARGLELLATERPDSAILDVDLGGILVTPVATALRAAAIPFVLVTGCDPERLKEPVLEHAPRLPKPLDDVKLVHWLGQTLGLRGP